RRRRRAVLQTRRRPQGAQTTTTTRGRPDPCIYAWHYTKLKYTRVCVCVNKSQLATPRHARTPGSALAG
uniref:Uncharacterized protein n=1 Tax=Aegilops tauschii subsp. strangulata TaxID=200361 RepID=A0A453FVY1_AEGTS